MFLKEYQSLSSVVEGNKDLISDYMRTVTDIKDHEKSLTFKPIVGKPSLLSDVEGKLESLSKLKKHLVLQSVSAEDSWTQVDELVSTYNDLIESLSFKFAELDAAVSELEEEH